jgi:hypothetical protein
MFIVRRTQLAQPGRRDEAVALVKEMMVAMENELGYPKARVITGSVGPSDSTIETEVTIGSLGEFEASLQKANAWSGMARFADKVQALIVPGSGRFEIYRVQK